MKGKTSQFISIFFLFALCAPFATAQNHRHFYVGGSFSLTDATIVDQFSRFGGDGLVEKNMFEDEYNGQAYGFYFGYTLLNSRNIFVNLQMHGGFFGDEFLVETTDSVVKRKLACTRGLDLQPGYNVTKDFFFFFDFSLERGRFQFSKEGTSTTYDVELPVMGYGFGVGIGYRVISSLAVRILYQYTQYGSTEISSTVEDPELKIDVVELMPKYDSIMLSFHFIF